MNTALLFPGQGSQRVGMGRDLAIKYDVAKQTYAEADDVLGFALSKLCFDGPEDDLTLTKNTQPAILTTSIAVFRVLREKGLAFDIVAGHSLGEWSALVAAGALELRDAVKLTHLRGTFMQEAVPVGAGAMAALMGLDVAAARAVCEKCSAPGEPVEPANLNGAGQIVISGHAAAIDRAIIEAKAAGAKRAVKLAHLRGTFMQEAVPVGEGAMAALMRLDIAAVRTLCEKCSTAGEPVEPANLNGAGQIVISGHAAAIDRAIIEAKAAGAKRAVKLQVSAPFHCSLMKPAGERLAAALAEITIKAPSVPVVANVTAEPTQDPARIKQLLVEQVTAPVRWEESIQAIAKLGVTKAYELGSGAVLKGLVKRIAEAITVTTIGEPHETEAFTA